MRRSAVSLGCGLFASLLVAALITHARRGYFVTPPSGAGVVASAEAVGAVTHFHVTKDGRVEREVPARYLANDPDACAMFEVVCLEGRLLGTAASRPKASSTAIPSDQTLKDDAKAACGDMPGEKWGMSMDLRLQSGPARILSCRTAELDWDIHLYREVLRTADGTRELAAYRYEIAGLEVLTMPVVAVLVFVVGWVLFTFAQFVRWGLGVSAS